MVSLEPFHSSRFSCSLRGFRMSIKGGNMKRSIVLGIMCIGVSLVVAAGVYAGPAKAADPVLDNATRMVEEGRQIFRYDTFGDEAFWGDTLQLHRAIAGQANGGVGPGVSPRTALAVGLKVDQDALPPPLLSGIRQGTVDLDNPATTVALLKLNAVVGV